MAFSKAHKFDDAIQHFALLCDALSHPARIIILQRIIQTHGGRLSFNELCAGLPISRQTLSGHLRKLRDMSVLACHEEHPYVFYSLNTELLNTCIVIFSLVTQAELKHDDNYRSEIKVVGARRRIGTAPL